MQPSRRVADQLAKAMLDSHVDVFELLALWNAIALIFRRDPVQAFEDRRGIGLGDDALFSQHRSMGLRAAISSRHKRLSKRIEALISRIRSGGIPPKRPPQVRCDGDLSLMPSALPREAAGGQTSWSP